MPTSPLPEKISDEWQPGKNGGKLLKRGPGRHKGSVPKLTIQRVELELRRIALFDPRKLIGRVKKSSRQFTLREIAELPDDVAAAISSFDVVLDNQTAGDGHQDTVVKVRWYDKRDTLALLAKHFGYVTDKVTIALEPELRSLLEAGRMRNAQRLAGGSTAGCLPAAAVQPALPAVLEHASEPVIDVTPAVERTHARKAAPRAPRPRAHAAPRARTRPQATPKTAPAESDSDSQFDGPLDTDPAPPEI